MSTAAELSAELAARVESLATMLVGQEPTQRTRTEWRFYPRGGLCVTIAGPKRGVWCHHGDGGIGGDALDLIRHLRRCGTVEALDWARAFLGKKATQLPAPYSTAPAPDEASQTAARIECARRTWMVSTNPAGTPVEAYLASRGLTLPDAPVLRFHPQCPRGADRFPAMVALMSNAETREPTGIHRTFLRPDGSGKADVSSAKMMLDAAGVVELVDRRAVGEALGLAEGIETALAVSQRIGWGPCWAVLSAGGIGAFPVLPGTVLHVFGDHDPAGVKATRRCADRWAEAGAGAYAHFPATGTDWLDVAGPGTLARIDRAVIAADRRRG